MEREYGELEKEDVALYIQEIKTGSIITDLIGLSSASLPLLTTVENMAAVIHFGSFLKTCYDFLLGRISQRPNLLRNNYENLSGFVEPTAKDNAAQLNVNTVINGDVNLIFSLSSIDANAAQNAARREIGLLQEPVSGLRRNVALYWYQAKKDLASQTGDRVIIESIYPYPVKSIFDNENVKRDMLLGVDNPFTHAYIVDVGVETVKGKPVLYKILSMHDRITPPSQDPFSLSTRPPSTPRLTE